MKLSSWNGISSSACKLIFVIRLDIVFNPSMSDFKDETSILSNIKRLNENIKYHIFHYTILYRKRHGLYGIYYLIALTRGKLRGGK